MSTRFTTWSRYGLSVLMAVTALPLVAGCGGERATAVIDAAALLERMEQDRRRHDPHAYSELDLGEYTITWRGGEPTKQDVDPPGTRTTGNLVPATVLTPVSLIIRFHLYAVVSDNRLEECRSLLTTHGERVRSQVRQTVQGSDRGHLEESALGSLKSELIESINQSLQAPILRDVAFAEFALDRA